MTFILVDAALGGIIGESWAGVVAAFSMLLLIVVVGHFKSKIRLRSYAVSSLNRPGLCAVRAVVEGTPPALISMPGQCYILMQKSRVSPRYRKFAIKAFGVAFFIGFVILGAIAMATNFLR